MTKLIDRKQLFYAEAIVFTSLSFTCTFIILMVFGIELAHSLAITAILLLKTAVLHAIIRRLFRKVDRDLRRIEQEHKDK